MNFTEYDEIWESFLENCGYDRSELPQLDENRYSMIRNSIKIYNEKASKYEGRVQCNVVADDIMECLNVKLKDNEMLALSNIMGMVLVKNKFTEFTSIYGVFAKEMGFKDYKAQIDARQYTIKMYEDEANRILEDSVDSFDL